MPKGLTLATFCLASSLMGFSTLGAAINVPLKGWTPFEGDVRWWQDATGMCLIREERYSQALPALPSAEKATQFSVVLRDALAKNKNFAIKDVTTQVIDHGGSWAILASYQMGKEPQQRVWQLYMSDKGLLRTVTGSVTLGSNTVCANEMREFLRYSAR